VSEGAGGAWGAIVRRVRCCAIQLLAILTLVGCRRPPTLRNALDLPDAIAGFIAGAPETGPGYQRRTYTAGTTRIAVTLARYPMDDAAYESWVATSRAGFPQADLGLPPDAGNGFYQCAVAAADRCDLLIQLRAGVHVEIRGGGTSRRRDVDAIRSALPLAALASLDLSGRG
jgi:hypothetical protein